MALLLFARIREAVVPIEVAPDATVQQLRKAVAAAGGPAPGEQALVVGGELLLCGDDVPLADANLAMQMTISVEKKRRGRSVLSVGAKHGLALLESGRVIGWGAAPLHAPVPDFGGRRVVSVHAGRDFSAALLDEGVLAAWGVRADTLGGQFIDQFTGRDVAWFDAYPGFEHNHSAVLDDGSLVTTASFVPGHRYRGRVSAAHLGAGQGVLILTDGSAVFVDGDGCEEAPLDGRAAVSARAGYKHSAVVLDDGTVRCFGQNDCGQTAPPAGLSRVVASDCCTNITTALQEDGELACWGGEPRFGSDYDSMSKHRYTAIATYNRTFAGGTRDGRLVCVSRSTRLLRTPDLGGDRVQA